MAELSEWLKQHGLEAISAVLTENDIDLDILPDITEHDLEKLGLTLGQRRRLLKATATLKANTALPHEPALATASEPAAPREAERRQVTVMFCDLVGSTELSGKLDPEDLSKLIRGYQDACAGAITRFDGLLAKLMGDGVLAYFGFPRAHEDSAERAVRAALAILAEVPNLTGSQEQRLRARIGIATGLVVVGDIVGEGVAREQSIVGETPNLAARLQSLAEPDTLLISQSTYRLIGRTFDAESMGEHAIKGFPQPVTVWRIKGESAVPTRFAAARGATTAPLVGRQHEMGLLDDRWRLAGSGEGQFVLLTGEAGIGKSRLVEAMLEGCDQEPRLIIGLQCSSNYTNTALYPVTRYVERAAGFQADDSPARKVDKLAELLKQTWGDPPSNAVAMFAQMMSLPAEVHVAAAESVSPQQRKTVTIEAFVKHVIQLARQTRVLFLLEDAHWIDPTTTELIGQLIDAIESSRVLAVVTARPEFISPWSGRAHVTQLTLNRLGRAQCAQIVAGLSATHAIAAETLDEIVAKTDGVPLFVEELTKAILESSAPGRAAVPATLQDSLMARLDRLGEAKEIAQVAAVIGRQFPLGLLAAVSPLRGPQLEQALASLMKGEIVFPQRQSNEPSYTFKHALMRDAAYDSLLRSRRQTLHARIAEALSRDFPKVGAEEPELLAYHFEMAGLADPAARYHEQAGDRAVAKYAYSEAIAHYDAALVQLQSVPDQISRELPLRFKLQPALIIFAGYQSEEAAENGRRAYEMAKALGDGPDLFKATWNLWIADNIGRRTDAALARAEELVALGNRLNDDDLLLEAIHCRWSTAWFHGDIDIAFRDSREGVRRYDPARRSSLSYGAGHDTGPCAHGMQAMTLALAGNAERVRQSGKTAIKLAEQLGHPPSLAHAYSLAAIASIILGNRAETARISRSLAEISEKYRFPPQHVTGLFFLGWAQAQEADLAAGLPQMETHFDRVRTIGVHPQLIESMMADVLLQAGRVEEAYRLAEQTLTNMKETDPNFFLGLLLDVRKRCLARMGCESDLGALPPRVARVVELHDAKMRALKDAAAQPN